MWIVRLALRRPYTFVVMALLTIITKHLVFPGTVNDANVGWWERAYAIVLVGWVGVAAIVMERPVYVREMSDGLYSPLTYLLYKVSAPHTQTGTALCCLPASMR